MSGGGYFTLSVDDGAKEDLVLARLFERRGIRATFYVPKNNPERPVISDSEIKSLEKAGFDIECHAWSHTPLTKMSRPAVAQELQNSKKWLESLLSRPVPILCYPQGRFNSMVQEEAKTAGFSLARTIRCFQLEEPKNPFSWDLTLQIYPHSRAVHIRHALKEMNCRGLTSYFTTFKAASSWTELARSAVRAVQERGGVAHLFCHGWEIVDSPLLQELDSFLSEVKTSGLQSVSNRDLLKTWETH